MQHITNIENQNKEIQEKLNKNIEIYLHTLKHASKMEGELAISEANWKQLEKWLRELLQNLSNRHEQCEINNNIFASLDIESNMNLLGEILEKMQEIKEENGD